jgi:hypothetical protein
MDYIYPEDVDMTDALIGPLHMVLVCFVLYMMDSANVAIHLA